MNEGFDANKDCVTGMEIPVKTILKVALEQPFDDICCITGVPDWDLHAALAVLKDLSWRNVIGPVLKDCDKPTRVALAMRARDIIAAAAAKQIEELRAETIDLASDISALERELEDERKRRIKAENDLDINPDAAQARLLNAKTLLLEIEAEERSRTPSKPTPECRLADLPETVDQISRLTEERDEAVSRADLADYCREALAARCKDLEAQLAVEGRVLGADVQVSSDGFATVTVSEVVEPGFEHRRFSPVTVTTEGSDVFDVLQRHEKAVAFYLQEDDEESEAA
jgi:hypothetical protein